MADDLGTCPHCGGHNPSVDIAIETAARLLWRIQQIMVGAPEDDLVDAEAGPPTEAPPFLGGEPWPSTAASPFAGDDLALGEQHGLLPHRDDG